MLPRYTPIAQIYTKVSHLTEQRTMPPMHCSDHRDEADHLQRRRGVATCARGVRLDCVSDRSSADARSSGSILPHAAAHAAARCRPCGVCGSSRRRAGDGHAQAFAAGCAQAIAQSASQAMPTWAARRSEYALMGRGCAISGRSTEPSRACASVARRSCRPAGVPRPEGRRIPATSLRNDAPVTELDEGRAG